MHDIGRVKAMLAGAGKVLQVRGGGGNSYLARIICWGRKGGRFGGLLLNVLRDGGGVAFGGLVLNPGMWTGAVAVVDVRISCTLETRRRDSRLF